MSEKRKHTRYKITVNITVGTGKKNIHGIAYSISGSGIHIVLPEILEVGQSCIVNSSESKTPFHFSGIVESVEDVPNQPNQIRVEFDNELSEGTLERIVGTATP